MDKNILDKDCPPTKNNKRWSWLKNQMIALGIASTLIGGAIWCAPDNNAKLSDKEDTELIEKEPLQEGDYDLSKDEMGIDDLWSLYEKKYKSNTPVLELSKSDVFKKPLDLHYIHKVKDKKITIEKSSSDYVNRAVKVLRFADIADEIEKIYGIPSWLLLALAAHESTGDPLLPNLGGDGWAGLSHIQGINAKKFWLTTLPLYNDRMIDRKHGKDIKHHLEKWKQHMDYMIDKDDRFHPVLGLDVVGRFLLDLKYRHSHKYKWPDLWLHILKRYSGRWDAYVRGVLEHRYTIQSYRNKNLPTFSKWYQEYISSLTPTVQIRKKLINGEIVKEGNIAHTGFHAKIDGKKVTTQWYINFFQDRLENYEFDKYKSFMERKSIFADNDIIDQNVINSQWFRIYKKDNVSSIPNTIKLLNDLNNGSYKKVGTDNIVDRQGNVLKKLPPNKQIYIKIKYTSRRYI